MTGRGLSFDGFYFTCGLRRGCLDVLARFASTLKGGSELRHYVGGGEGVVRQLAVGVRLDTLRGPGGEGNNGGREIRFVVINDFGEVTREGSGH